MDVHQNKRPAPFGVRLTPEERADLESRAERAGLSAGGYLKAVVFNTSPPRRSHRPTAYNQQLSQLLAVLGSIGSNVNRCALLANMGSWPQADRLQTVADTVQETCQNIMRELGKSPHDPKDQDEP